MIHPLRHLRTVVRHRHRVISHCRRAGILLQGLTHDLSKFSPREFFAGAKYYRGTCSPNEAERRALGYSAAWMHHKGRNRHHYEYWTDINPATGELAPVEMPVRYAAEMFCDRVAASKIYQGKAYTDAHPLAYFEGGRAKNAMHPATARLLREWLTLLAEEGEDAAFRAVRQAVRAARKNKNKSK
ncbi:MAG: catalase [Clostridia bacterium]|nr:catalase [Clostridia bacterium]